MHDNDLVSRGHIQSPTRPARPAVTRPATGERGRGERGGGGHDNATATHAATARPLTRPATGERGDGGGGGEGEGHDKDGQHDHIQSPTRAARPVTGEVGEGGGEGDKRVRVGRGMITMITTLFHAASTTTSSHPPRNGQTNDCVGGCFAASLESSC